MKSTTAYRKIKEYVSRPDAVLGREDDGPCYYRHPEDPSIRCAVGCLIPNTQYYPSLEGRNALVARGTVKVLQGLDPEYLLEVQQAHDAALTVEDFLEQFEEISRNYGVI